MATGLLGLPAPKVLESVDFQDILDRILANFTARDPDYLDIIESDPAYTIMEAMSYAVDFVMERVNSAAMALLVTHATGSDLEHLGALFSVTRRTSESDDVLRERVLESLETIVPGSSAWYREYATQVEVVEIDGVDNVVDGVETPVASRVQDARSIRTPNSAYVEADGISVTNLPDIPGSLDVFIQSGKWTHPDTGVVTEVVPSARMLQAVRDYIDAESSAETDADLQSDAEDRRFVCDTVNVLEVGVRPYVLCAKIVVVSGLDALTVLRDVQTLARAFVSEETRIGNRVPLSSFYKVLDIEDVSEVTLMLPSSDLEPDSDAVPVAFGEQPLEVEDYREFSNVSTFAAETEPSWSIGEVSSDWKLLFRVDATEMDYEFLSHLVGGRRVAVFSQDTDGEPVVPAIQIYRVAGNLEAVSTTHYQVSLGSVAPLITGLTDDDAYTLRLLDSVEIFV